VTTVSIPFRSFTKVSLKKALLFCAIFFSLFYVALNVFIPMQLAVDTVSQTVSELSALGSAARRFWIWLSIPYILLMAAFAWGVWHSAGQDRRLRIAGTLMIIYGAVGIIWLFAPMHLREKLTAGGSTFSDTLHLVLEFLSQIFYVVALGFAAAAFAPKFRFYAIATFFAFLIFGMLTYMDTPGVAVNSRAPLIGIWGFVDIGVFLLWVVLLVTTLLRAPKSEFNRK